MPITRHIAPILLLIAITLLVYYDSFNNSFVWDDNQFVVENQSIRSLSLKNIISLFTDKDTASASRYLADDVWRPLTILSFAVDYRLWGLNPRFYHIENAILHIINAILVYAVTILILGDSLIAIMTALVFSIHPVQTEAVTWISGRANVLFLLFFLLSFISHINNRKDPARSFYYGLSLGLYFLSLLSKEMAICLPLVLLLYDLHFHTAASGDSKRHSVRYYIGYYLPFFLISAFYLLARLAVLGRIAQKEGWWGEGIASNFFIMLKAIMTYLNALFLPVNLTAGYVFSAPKSIFDEGVISAALLMLFIAYLYTIVMRKKEISFYILWFFVTLIPVYNIVPFKAVMAERFLYLPSVAFAALFGIVFSTLLRRFSHDIAAPYILGILFIGILCLYGAATIARNIEWRNELRFFTKETMHSPGNPSFHYNLGLLYKREAEKLKDSEELSKAYYASSLDELKKAVDLRPGYQFAYIVLGDLYNDLRLYDLAIESLKKAISIKEDEAAYNNLGISYYNKRMYDKAVRCAKKSLILKPDQPNAYINLGNAYFMQRKFSKAKAAWLMAVKNGDDGKNTLENIKDLEKVGY